MKKSLLSLTAFLTVFSVLFGTVNALEITDVFAKEVPLVDTAYTQVLNDYDSSWGYFDDNIVECNSNEGILTIKSPKIEDSTFDTATTYRLFVSPYRIGDIREGKDLVNNADILMKEEKIESNAEDVTFNIESGDFDPNRAYYGFILPIDIYDEIGTPSKEICFQLDQNLCMLDSACDSLDLILNPVEEQEPEDTEEHGAANCVSMEYANVRHTSDGKNITLTWTAVAGGDTVEISVFNPEEEVYEKLGKVKMSAEKYVYKMRWNGVHRFVLTNDCGEAKYKADEGITASEPEKIVPPATGPAENILYIAIAAIVIYGAYTIFSRKSEN